MEFRVAKSCLGKQAFGTVAKDLTQVPRTAFRFNGAAAFSYVGNRAAPYASLATRQARANTRPTTQKDYESFRL
jgi:hypothetical protein